MQLRNIRPEVITALTRVPEVAKQVREAAVVIRDDARRRAPVRTGALRRSIKVERAFDETTRRVSYHVGWDRRIAFYGPLVELGTEDTAARPHLRPAADEFNRS